MLAAYVALVAVYGVTFSLSMKGHRQTALHAHEQDGKASNFFVESLLNFETVKAFVAERAVMARSADLFGERSVAGSRISRMPREIRSR